MRQRIEIDTNVYVSAVIYRMSVPGRAVSRAWDDGVTLQSQSAWDELQTVFQKPKLSRYIDSSLLQGFLARIRAISVRVPIPTPIRACRDPRDDKFLELAVHGKADPVITGDDDLLVLHPFQGIQILTPADFLAR